MSSPLEFLPYTQANEIPAAERLQWHAFVSARPSEARAIATATRHDYEILRAAVQMIAQELPTQEIVERLNTFNFSRDFPLGDTGPHVHWLGQQDAWRPGMTAVQNNAHSFILPDGTAITLPFNANDVYTTHQMDALRTASALERYRIANSAMQFEPQNATLMEGYLGIMSSVSKRDFDDSSGAFPFFSPEALFSAAQGDPARAEQLWRTAASEAIHQTHFLLALPTNYHESGMLARVTDIYSEIEDFNSTDEVTTALAHVYEDYYGRFYTGNFSEQMPRIERLSSGGFMFHEATRSEIFELERAYYSTSSQSEKAEIVDQLQGRLEDWMREAFNPERMYDEYTFLKALLQETGLDRAMDAAFDINTPLPDRIDALRMFFSNTYYPSVEEIQSRYQDLHSPEELQQFQSYFDVRLEPVFQRLINGEMDRP